MDRGCGLKARHAGVRGQRGADLQPGDLVALVDDQGLGDVAGLGSMAEVAQPVTHGGAGEPGIGQHPSLTQHQQLDQRLPRRRRALVAGDIEAVDGHRAVRIDADDEIDQAVAPADAFHDHRTYRRDRRATLDTPLPLARR